MPDASALPEGLRVRNSCPSLMGLVISFNLAYREVMAHPSHLNRSWKQHVQNRPKLSRPHNVSGAAWPCVSRPCHHLLSFALGASRSRLLPHLASQYSLIIRPFYSIRTVFPQSALTPTPRPVHPARYLWHCVPAHALKNVGVAEKCCRIKTGIASQQSGLFLSELKYHICEREAAH